MLSVCSLVMWCGLHKTPTSITNLYNHCGRLPFNVRNVSRVLKLTDGAAIFISLILYTQRDFHCGKYGLYYTVDFALHGRIVRVQWQVQRFTEFKLQLVGGGVGEGSRRKPRSCGIQCSSCHALETEGLGRL